MDYEEPSGTFRNLLGSLETLRDPQEPSGTFRDLQEPSGTFRNLHGPSGTFRNLQGPSKTVRDFHGPSGTFRDPQVPSGTFRDPQVPSGTFTEASLNFPWPLGTFHNLKKAKISTCTRTDGQSCSFAAKNVHSRPKIWFIEKWLQYAINNNF